MGRGLFQRFPLPLPGRHQAMAGLMLQAQGKIVGRCASGQRQQKKGRQEPAFFEVTRSVERVLFAIDLDAAATDGADLDITAIQDIACAGTAHQDRRIGAILGTDLEFAAAQAGAIVCREAIFARGSISLDGQNGHAAIGADGGRRIHRIGSSTAHVQAQLGQVGQSPTAHREAETAKAHRG